MGQFNIKPTLINKSEHYKNANIFRNHHIYQKLSNEMSGSSMQIFKLPGGALWTREQLRNLFAVPIKQVDWEQ